MILNLVTVSFDFYLAFTAPDEGEFCLTEILGNKITLFSCPISTWFFVLFNIVDPDLHQDPASPHNVCPSGPCIEVPCIPYLPEP